MDTKTLEKLQRIYDQADTFGKELMEKEFPELKESDDEKTKRMLDIITYKMSQHQPDIFTGEENEWFNAWLEKQGNKTIVTPQWMIDFLDEHRRHFGTPMDYDERKEVDGKLLCIKEWLEKQGEKNHNELPKRN